MAVQFVVAITDSEWFEHLAARPDLDEVNFWSPNPGGFRALQRGEQFFFKLHHPQNYIVGGGTFTYASTVPCSLAWEAFGAKNGADTLAQMRARIAKYLKKRPDDRTDFPIGCRILTNQFFLNENQWVDVPETWSKNIVRFKRYSTADPEGLALWEAIHAQRSYKPLEGVREEQARYGAPRLVETRLGQGAFRLLVTQTYKRKCAVSGEKTLPALDAAHIIPYGEGGAHEASNGLLLRRDIHCLFDLGYVTVAPDMRFEVSRRIREDYENGRDYYALQGRRVAEPEISQYRPARSALEWHNEHRFLS